MSIIAILKGIQTVAEIVIPLLGWLSKRKAKKKAAKVALTLASVIRGVEQFAEVNKNSGGVDVKTYIQSRAQADGTEIDLNPLVKEITK